MIIRPKNVVIDIDGVLAEFNIPFAKRLSDASGIPLEQFTFTEWHWYRKTGIDKQLVTEVWDSICDPLNAKEQFAFWHSLRALPWARELIKWFVQHPLEYTPHFVTARSPILHEVTYLWLKDTLHVRNPRLIFSDEKGYICAGLNATHFIDDKYDNCLNVLRMRGTRTLVNVLDQPYNQRENETPYIHRLSSLREFLELLEDDARGGSEVLKDQRCGGASGGSHG